MHKIYPAGYHIDSQAADSSEQKGLSKCEADSCVWWGCFPCLSVPSSSRLSRQCWWQSDGRRETCPFLLRAARSPRCRREAMEVGVPVAEAAQQSSFKDLFHLPNFTFGAWLSVCLGKGECLLTSAGSLQLLLRIKRREIFFFVHLKALFYRCNTLPWQCLSPGL